MIARHIKLKECIEERTIAKLKEELVRFKESHIGQVCSLEEKVKKAEDKYLVGQKEWEVQEKELRSKVATLEKKFREHENFYSIEVAELKEMLEAKTQYADNLEGETVK